MFIQYTKNLKDKNFDEINTTLKNTLLQAGKGVTKITPIKDN